MSSNRNLCEWGRRLAEIAQGFLNLLANLSILFRLERGAKTLLDNWQTKPPAEPSQRPRRMSSDDSMLVRLHCTNQRLNGRPIANISKCHGCVAS